MTNNQDQIVQKTNKGNQQIIIGETDLMKYCQRQDAQAEGILAIIKDSSQEEVLKKNSTGKTALHYACELNKTQLVKLLLERTDLNPWEEDEEGLTPIEILSSLNQVDILRLIKGKFDLGNITSKGRGGLHSAALFNSSEAASFFIDECDANCDLLDSESMSPLHYAAKANAIKAIKILLDAGADIELFNDSLALTPLMVAILHNAQDAVELLSMRGADPFSQLSRGDMNAIDLAVFMEADKLINIMVAHHN